MDSFDFAVTDSEIAKETGTSPTFLDYVIVLLEDCDLYSWLISKIESILSIINRLIMV